jgi:hypothetical protein
MAERDLIETITSMPTIALALVASPLVVWLLMAAFFSGVLWLMKR